MGDKRSPWFDSQPRRCDAPALRKRSNDTREIGNHFRRVESLRLIRVHLHAEAASHNNARA